MERDIFIVLSYVYFMEDYDNIHKDVSKIIKEAGNFLWYIKYEL